MSASGPLLAGLAAEVGLMPGTAGPAQGAANGGTAELLAGLNSPLAAAGLLAPTATPEGALVPPAIAADSTRVPVPDAGAAAFKTTMAATLDTPATPLADGGRLGLAMPAADVQPTQPLAPAWITTLQTPALRHGPWPDPQAPVRQREQQRRQPHADGDEFEDDAPTPQATQAHATDVDAAPDDAHAVPWPGDTLAQLPDDVQAELARRRTVLLVAPPGPGQRGLQLVCLGFNLRGQPLLRRWAVRGADAATAGDAGTPRWKLWRVRREGEDGQRPVLTARALPSSQQPDISGLVLRVTATVLPAPLRPAGHAWLDVLEPQRLWRDLGSQWTLLLAWAPHPLRWEAA